MNCRYILLECRIETRISFGIAAVYDCDETVVILQSFVDLCSNRQAVADFTDRCNALELSLYHLQDAVEDFLAQI